MQTQNRITHVCPHTDHTVITSQSSFVPPVLEQDIEFFSDAGFDLDRLNIRRNAAVAQLYEDAIMNEGAVIGADGALIVSSILGDRHAMHMCTSTEAQLILPSCQCS